MKWLIRLKFNVIGTSILESDTRSLEARGFRHNSTAHLQIRMGERTCRGYNATASEEEAPAFVQASNASKPKEEAHAVFIQWTTTEPCCVTYDDDPEVKRAKMPCGCVVGKTHKTQVEMETSTQFYSPARARHGHGQDALLDHLS